jgi:hypothetical protein
MFSGLKQKPLEIIKGTGISTSGEKPDGTHIVLVVPVTPLKYLQYGANFRLIRLLECGS